MIPNEVIRRQMTGNMPTGKNDLSQYEFTVTRRETEPALTSREEAFQHSQTIIREAVKPRLP